MRVLADLKRALEAHPTEKPEFVCTTYITTTSKRRWRVLTDPAFSRDYQFYALANVVARIIAGLGTDVCGAALAAAP